MNNRGENSLENLLLRIVGRKQKADADRTLLEYKRLEAIKQEDDKVHEQSEKVKIERRIL